MMIDEKLDRLLADTAIMKTKLDFHSEELQTLKQKLEPVFYHVNGMRWFLKLGAGILGILSCLAAVLLLMK